MITRAQLNYVRITPRKFRQIIPLIKGKNPEVAIQILTGVKKGASQYAIALLRSAIANTKRVQGLDQSSLYISRLVANCGPSLKRFRAASMGRASMIKKRTSHIILELDQTAASKEAAAHAEHKAKAKKPAKKEETATAKKEVKAKEAKTKKKAQ